MANAAIASSTTTSTPAEVHSYSVWAVPSDDACRRIKKVMEGLRAEFGGPQIEQPHIPVVGSIRMTREDAVNKFTSLDLSRTPAYVAKVGEVVTRNFYYQCVSLLFPDSNDQLWQTAGWCGVHFGFRCGVMPLLSLLYGTLTEEEKKKAQERVGILDESISSMSFTISRLALYKIDYKDKTLKSWEKIAERHLQPN